MNSIEIHLLNADAVFHWIFAMTIVHAIPEPGQVVSVRHRQYVVTDIQQTRTLSSPMVQSLETLQHLVSLASIEDDALGEELQTIWEVEAGAYIYERVDLPKPTGFDEPGRLEAFLDAVRWGAASSADIRNVQAPFRSGIDIEDYQLDPVVRAIQMPRVNLLVADDVGLGKTIALTHIAAKAHGKSAVREAGDRVRGVLRSIGDRT